MTEQAGPSTRPKKAPSTKQAGPGPGKAPLDAVDVKVPPKKRATPGKRKPSGGTRRGATKPLPPDEFVAARERERTAVALAAAGVTYDRIAEVVGYGDRGTAYRAVHRSLDRQEFAATADYRRLIGYRLEQIIRVNWEAATKMEESPAKERATLRVFRALTQITRTFGLDLEVDKIADALRVPESTEERAAELRALRENLRVVGGTAVGD